MKKVIKELGDFFFKKHVWRENEQRVLNIVDSLLVQEDTTFLNSSLSRRYYLSNKRLHYYVRITDFDVTITNTKFNYALTYESRFGTEVTKRVSDWIELKIQTFDAEAFDSEVALLYNIERAINKF